MRTTASWIGLLFGAAALILQFGLAIPLRIGNGDTLIGAMVYFFTFYTILTNLMLVLIYASDLWPRQGLSWWRTPVTRGMMAAVIVLVCLFYHFLLASTWNPQGWAKVADVALHYITPLLYLGWWVVWCSAWHCAGTMSPEMLLPARRSALVAYVEVRGALIVRVSVYRSSTLKLPDGSVTGYGIVFVSVGVLVLLVAAFDAVLVIATRRYSRRCMRQDPDDRTQRLRRTARALLRQPR